MATRATVEAPPRDRAEKTHLGIHVLFVPGILVIGFLIARAVRHTIGDPQCASFDDALPSWWLMIVGIAGFVGGRYLSRLAGVRQFPRPSDPAQLERRHRDDARILWFTLTLVLIVFTLAWIYEAIGVSGATYGQANIRQYEPITFYVRCAIAQDLKAVSFLGLFPMGWIAPIMIATMSGIVGHWLFSSHPARSLELERLKRVSVMPAGGP